MNEETYWQKYNKTVAGMLIGFMIAIAMFVSLLALVGYLLFNYLK